MKPTLIFGTFAIGFGSIQGSYIAPANLPKEELKILSFDQAKEEACAKDGDEVTHEVFFGENIQRVMKTLSRS